MATTNINVRTDSALKTRAQAVLADLGLDMSTAINIYLNQIVYRRAIPFEMSLPAKPRGLEEMSKEELDAELEKGWADFKAGRCYPAEEVFAELEREFG